MTNSKTVNEVDQDNFENWEAVEEKFPKFWDFKKNKTYIGKFVENYRYENPEKKQLIEGFLFEDKEGFKSILNQSYQIGQAIEKYGKVMYKIEFMGTTPLEGGRKVNEYRIATSTSI